MNPIRFLMLGGFLGAGKTTTIARLARHHQSRGLKVGIVTNDQATDLVDTNSLRAQGFDVGERLWEIDRSTLILHGTEDRTVAVENGYILAERIPRAELHLLEGAGHLYHSERADEADAAVLDFIRRNGP